MAELTVGIIGCGRMGKERARSAAACGARVIAVYDVYQAQAVTLAALYPGCFVAGSVDDLIKQRPAVLFVCSPPSSRGPAELAAIDAQIPFLVEKPIGLSAKSTVAVLKALRARSIVHAVGYQNRSRHSVCLARRCLADCRILAISAFWVGRKYNVPWWPRTEHSGGPINEQATHLVDLCRYLCGEVAEVGSLIGGASGNADESLTAAVMLRFESGAFGSLLYSCEAEAKQIAVRIITDKGGLTLSSWDLSLSVNEISPGDTTNSPEDIFLRETARFLEAVRSKNISGVGCTFEDAWRSQQVVDHILASSRGCTKLP